MRVLIAAAVLALAVPAAAQQVRGVPPGTQIEWSYEANPRPVRYGSGPYTLTMRGERSDEWDGAIEPVLTVELAGHAPAELRGSISSETLPHRVAVGRWDSARHYVLFQSFTGGAHCCNQVQVVLPENGVLRVVDLGTWDGDYLEEMPTDLDGDGAVDFAFADNAFLYRFSSYAGSVPPPQLLNIVGGEVVNVSDRPGFRNLFEETRREARELCLDRENVDRNGACAGYVAAAARVGRFDEAWAEMLRAHDRNSDWGLEGFCRVTPVDGECPAGQEQRFATYPDALRQFLIDTGYIAR